MRTSLDLEVPRNIIIIITAKKEREFRFFAKWFLGNREDDREYKWAERLKLEVLNSINHGT